jgi:hypothetical protein
MRASIVVRDHHGERPALATTDSSASSYGQPVIVIGNVPHGPGDLRDATLILTPRQDRLHGEQLRALDYRTEIGTQQIRGGRPRKGGSDAVLTERLVVPINPDLKAWVLDHGGASLVRRLLEAERERDNAAAV